jgi:hypothetical protein
MGHTAYLCEGWHTEKTNSLNFSNTDPLLIDLFLKCLRVVYSVTQVTIVIIAKHQEEAFCLLALYPNSKVYLEESRKTPIVKIRAGGKKLASEFISNAYSIISFKD